MKAHIVLLGLILHGFVLLSQPDVDRYLWEYPLQTNLQVDLELQEELRTEIQKILDAGTLGLRPIPCRYSDLMEDHYELYQEPGRLLHTIALAYPYLTAQQQDMSRMLVAQLLSDEIHRPWSNTRVPANVGVRRELYEPDSVWGVGSDFGLYRPTIQNVYSIWLYTYRTGDTSTVAEHYETIRSFYNNKVAFGVDPGNLYGTMSAHIGMARLANMFEDEAQVNVAANNLQTNLLFGLQMSQVDQAAAQGLSGWNAPYGRAYDERQDNWVYRGYIFLHISPEMVRYLRDEVYEAAMERHSYGLSRFPLWWMRQAQYFCRWTGDEGVGIPSEMMGMIMPLERWLVNRPAETMRDYLLSAPLGIGDAYWLEGLVYALESDAEDVWVDTRTTNFEVDVESNLLIWNGTVSHDWFNPLNWTPNRVPGQTDDVRIGVAAYYPIVEMNMQANVRNITIESGGRLLVRGRINED